MTHKFYTVEYLFRHGVLSFYVSYGYFVSKYWIRHVLNLPELNRIWKIFVDTKENYDDILSIMDSKGKNAVLTGYCKMDRLAEHTAVKRERKRIILAPHHTVAMPSFPLSNFLIYADFFSNLPQRYPNVDWVFRPHPLLYVTLCRDDVWGREKTEKYFKDIQSYKNLVYQDGGEYFDTFVNSDALIHDCGSYIAEYLFTGHPACYMVKDKAFLPELLNNLGMNCAREHYIATNEKEIVDFIEQVVLEGKDTKKEKRKQYVERNLMINYPHVTDFIINCLKKEICGTNTWENKNND